MEQIDHTKCLNHIIMEFCNFKKTGLNYDDKYINETSSDDDGEISNDEINYIDPFYDNKKIKQEKMKFQKLNKMYYYLHLWEKEKNNHWFIIKKELNELYNYVYDRQKMDIFNNKIKHAELMLNEMLNNTFGELYEVEIYVEYSGGRGFSCAELNGIIIKEK